MIKLGRVEHVDLPAAFIGASQNGRRSLGVDGGQMLRPQPPLWRDEPMSEYTISCVLPLYGNPQFCRISPIRESPAKSLLNVRKETRRGPGLILLSVG
jgi:hypothetical protein